MQRQTSQARRKHDHSASRPGTSHPRSGSSRSGHAASSQSLQALRKRPRIRGAPGSNRDSHPQRGAVHHDNRSGLVGDRRGRQDHGRHRRATAGARERPIGEREVAAWPRAPASVGIGLADERQELVTPPKLFVPELLVSPDAAPVRRLPIGAELQLGMDQVRTRPPGSTGWRCNLSRRRRSSLRPCAQTL